MEGVEGFTNRVENYARYRPGYPDTVVAFLQSALQLPDGGVVADVGSGTGKLGVPFLRAGFRVVGVEPNAAMRRAAAREAGRWPEFRNVGGTAEVLPLANSSVDLIVAGQAFHWFDAERARAEFARVLHAGAGVALVWNNRRTEDSTLLQEYEEVLLRHCPEYPRIGNQHYEAAAVRRFFGGALRYRRFDNFQELDREAFEGRVLSSSYAPASGAAHAALMADIGGLFDRHAAGGSVRIDYDTEVFCGSLQR